MSTEVGTKEPETEDPATTIESKEEDNKDEPPAANAPGGEDSSKDPEDHDSADHVIEEEEVDGNNEEVEEEEEELKDQPRDTKESSDSPNAAAESNAPTVKNPLDQDATSSLPLRPIKRARTAYFIFTDEKRPQVQAEHPGEGVAIVSRIMGQLWAALKPEEKETYQQKAAHERERVAQELEAWRAAGGGGDGELDPHAGPAATKLGSHNQPWSSSAGAPKDSSSLIYPVARIKKICKLDPEVRGISKEGLFLITKCAELFTSKLGVETVRVAQMQNRRKLVPDDVAQVCGHREQFLFLKEDVKDLVKDMMMNHSSTKDDGKPVVKKGDTTRELAAAGTKPLTAYFGAKN